MVLLGTADPHGQAWAAGVELLVQGQRGQPHDAVKQRLHAPGWTNGLHGRAVDKDAIQSSKRMALSPKERKAIIAIQPVRAVQDEQQVPSDPFLLETPARHGHQVIERVGKRIEALMERGGYGLPSRQSRTAPGNPSIQQLRDAPLPHALNDAVSIAMPVAMGCRPRLKAIRQSRDRGLAGLRAQPRFQQPSPIAIQRNPFLLHLRQQAPAQGQADVMAVKPPAARGLAQDVQEDHMEQVRAMELGGDASQLRALPRASVP